MADGTLGVQEPAPADVTKQLDTTHVTVGANDVDRERIQLAGAGAAELADVRNTTPGASDYGVVVRPVASPLPAGAATDAGLAAILAQLQLLGTEAKLEAIRALLATTLAVSGPLTDTQLRATAVPVSAAALPLPSGAATQATLASVLTQLGLLSTEAKLEAVRALLAAPLAVTGAFWQATQPVSGPVTDVQLRASAVPVSGPVTDTQLRASAVPVSGPITDTQLRASAVPVSIPASELHLGEVGGRIVPITATKTRTADGNVYAANDCINNATSGAAVLTFTGAARISGGSGFIVGAIASVNVAAEVEILELDLYTTSPAAIVADNAELTQLTADNAKYLGTITFPALAKKTANSTEAKAQDLSLRIPYSCSGSANLIAMIRTLSVFTPTSGAIYTFTLMCAQN